MTVKTIVTNQQELRRPCAPFRPGDWDLVPSLLRDMNDTMREAKGIGLAAIQIGAPVRIFIIASDKHPEHPMVFINPVITKERGTELYPAEGCLSLPGREGRVRRSKRIWIEYTDEYDRQKKLKGVEGRLAHIIQHEMDHLNGVLYIEKEEQHEA